MILVYSLFIVVGLISIFIVESYVKKNTSIYNDRKNVFKLGFFVLVNSIVISYSMVNLVPMLVDRFG